MKGMPLRAGVTIGAVAGSAALLVYALVRGAADLDPFLLISFGVLILLAEVGGVTGPHSSYSVGFVVELAAIIVAGPAVAAIASCFGSLDLLLRPHPNRVARFVFNTSQLCVSVGLAGTAYLALGGPVGRLRRADFPEALLPIAAATVVFYLLNSTLVSAMIVMTSGVRWREVFDTNYRGAVVSFLSYALLGVMLAILYLEMGWSSIAFLLVPLLVARRALQAAAKMHQQFESTLKTLITAIEAKDLYTRGHAERVSRLAAMVAREYGLPEPRIRQIRYAALMHDVGKLAVSTKILQKPGKLTAEEYDHMKIHPIRGSEIVAEIDLLAEMVDGVRHHHERMDGKGYPDGLAGDALSEPARIIMVSDAFDSMTSTRTYRRALDMEKALGELRRCQDTQFAREAIDALERAIANHGWEPMPEEFQGEQSPRPNVSPHAIHI